MGCFVWGIPPSSSHQLAAFPPLSSRIRIGDPHLAPDLLRAQPAPRRTTMLRPSVEMLCLLVEEKKPVIRAALLRHGAAGLLASHSQHTLPIRALLELTNYRYARRLISRQVPVLLSNLPKASDTALCTDAVLYHTSAKRI